MSWKEIVENKTEWIGGILEEISNLPDDDLVPTRILDVSLTENYFIVEGENYTCKERIENGIIQGKEGWTTLKTFRIKKKGTY